MRGSLGSIPDRPVKVFQSSCYDPGKSHKL